MYCLDDLKTRDRFVTAIFLPRRSVLQLDCTIHVMTTYEYTPFVKALWCNPLNYCPDLLSR